MWRNANCPTHELPAPSEMGWRLVDSELQPVLMTLNPITDSCLEMVACSCRKQCKTRRCKYHKSGLRCTSMCACQHQTDLISPRAFAPACILRRTSTSTRPFSLYFHPDTHTIIYLYFPSSLISLCFPTQITGTLCGN